LSVIDACIFDLDGVIVDSAKFHFLAWKEMAASQGIDFTPEDNEQLKGVGRMESLEFILNLGKKELSAKEKELLAVKKNEKYLALITGLDQGQMLPGVLTFLDSLQANKIQFALGSSSRNARFILEKLGIIDLFEAIIDGTNTTRSKPDPQVFQLGAEALGVDPNRTIVFEDALKGIEAAKKGGFKCIGIGNWETLVSADYVIEGFQNFTVNDLERIY